MPQNGLQEFREILSDVKSLTTWAIGGVVARPLVDLVLHTGPPWPKGVAVITSMVELISLMFVFHFWTGKNQKAISFRLTLSFMILLIGFFGYLFLFASYTFVNPATSARYAKGFVVKPEVAAMVPDLIRTPEAALAGLEYREEEVWTGGSIVAVRIVLLAVWLLTFGSIAAFIGTFVLAQRRRRRRARA